MITTAVGLRLVIFVSKVQRLYTDYSTDWMGGGGERRGVPPTGRQLPPLSSVLYGIISGRRSVLAAQLLLREKSGG